jgi:DNA-directed RNA polymerase subunit M
MEFCPNCEIRLKKNDSGSLHCPKCKYLKKKTVESTKEESEEANSEFLVMGEEDVKQSKGLESTVPIDCEKCHNKEGVSWTFQTRSADEPETKFYRCTKCNYTWRDYT